MPVIQERRLALLFRRPLVRALMVVCIVSVVLSHVDRSALIGYLSRVDTGFLVVMVAVNGILLLVSAWRWHWIAVAAAVRAPFGEFVCATWLSWAVSEVGPPLVFGEWARFQRLRLLAPPLQLAITQFVDRLSAYVGLLALAAVSAGAYAGSREGVAGFPGAVVGAVALTGGAIIVTVLLRRFRGTLKRDIALLAVLRNLLVRPAHYGLSLLTNLLFTVNFVLAAMAVGCDVSPWSLALIAPLVLLGTGSLPSLISDWGKREAAAAFAFAQIGVDPGQGVAISLVYGAAHLAGALPGLLIMLRDAPARFARG